MSSDKDFLQLCTGNVVVYSPTKKRIYGPAEVLDEYKIHPNNFVLYRALDGDDSDNVPNTIKRSDVNKRSVADLFDTKESVDEFIHSLQTKKHLDRKELAPIYATDKMYYFKINSLVQDMMNYK